MDLNITQYYTGPKSHFNILTIFTERHRDDYLKKSSKKIRKLSSFQFAPISKQKTILRR